MRLTVTHFVIILCHAFVKDTLNQSRVSYKQWKSRDHGRPIKIRRLRDLQSHSSNVFLRDRKFKNSTHFNFSNERSFENIVWRLKETGILDLPNVSVMRRSQSSHYAEKSKRHTSHAENPSKRCFTLNPCGGCSSSVLRYTIEEEAILEVFQIRCTKLFCFNLSGHCVKIKRLFDLKAMKVVDDDGSTWLTKTLEIPVACACARM